MPFQVGAPKSPQDIVAAYAANAPQRASKWVANSLKPRKDPIQAAIAAAQRWLDRLNSVGTAGFTAGLNAVDENAMADTISKSAGTYSSGITNKGVPKLTKIAPQLYPAIFAAAQNLPARGDANANDQRMLQMVAALRGLRGKFKATR